MDPQGWQPFAVTVSTEGDRATVVLKGELDLAGIDSAKQAIDQAEEVPGRMVVLDLSELTFMDSTGLEVVLRAARRASESAMGADRPSSRNVFCDKFYSFGLEIHLLRVLEEPRSESHGAAGLPSVDHNVAEAPAIARVCSIANRSSSSVLKKCGPKRSPTSGR